MALSIQEDFEFRETLLKNKVESMPNRSS